MRSVCFDTALVKAAPKEHHGGACSVCDKCQSVWLRQAPGLEISYVCSICLLYKSSWGEREKDNIKSLVEAVEARRGVIYEKTSEGNLANCREADALMASVYMVNQLQVIEKLRSK